MFHDEVRVLSAQQRFKGVDAKTLRLIAMAGERQTYGPGEIVIREGEEPEAVFVILSGEGELVGHADGLRASLGIMGPGSVIGEISAVLGEKRTVTLTTLGRLVALRIETTSYLELLREVPQLACATIRDLARRYADVMTTYAKARARCECEQGAAAATGLARE